MSISVRKHIRWIPNPATEPTSTLVLTSPARRFTDLRVLDPDLVPSPTATSFHALPLPTTKPATAATAAAAIGGPHRSAHAPALHASALEWAFAGTSETLPPKDDGGGGGGGEKGGAGSVDGAAAAGGGNGGASKRCRWTHWVDSRTAEPERVVDEADCRELDNGDVLETGCMVNPATGEDQEYEELWRELEVLVVGGGGASAATAAAGGAGADKVRKKDRGAAPGSAASTPASTPGVSTERKGILKPSSAAAAGGGGGSKRVCLVLQAENSVLMTKGMIVRVGQWCQGVMQTGGETTAERWRWVGDDGDGGGGGGGGGGGSGGGMGINGGGGAAGVVAAGGLAGGWERVVRVGEGSLPCHVLWEREEMEVGDDIRSGGLQWKVVEKELW